MCWSPNRVIKIPIAAFSIEARSVIYLLQLGQRIPYSGDVVEFEAAFSFRSSSAKLQDLQHAKSFSICPPLRSGRDGGQAKRKCPADTLNRIDGLQILLFGLGAGALPAHDVLHHEPESTVIVFS
jgi:hypothetical protein